MASVLASSLERLARRYDRRWIDTDPVSVPRRYEDAGDREVAAVVAASLAFGRVASILASVRAAMAALGPRPARTLAERSRGELERRLRPIRHRWVDGVDVAWLLEGVARARERHGSLGAFLAANAAGEAPLKTALEAWATWSAAVLPTEDPARRRARSFLLPSPARAGACKRPLLLARWCVRPDDGIDLGLWTSYRLLPRHLLVPLDVHAHRVSRLLGLTRRKTADWRAAEEVTAALREVDPEDPVRHDFAWVRAGILGLCRARWIAEVCGPCDLKPACRVGRGGEPGSR